MKTNITLRVDADLARDAKILAARKGTSVSRMVAEQLEEIVRSDVGYEKAQRRALDRLRKGFDLRWTPPASRDVLHER